MKTTRKLFCVLLAAMLLALSVVPAYAVTVDTSAAKLYLGSKDGSEWASGSISISDITADTRIKDIKSSNDNVVHVSGLDRWTSSWEYFDGETEGGGYSDASISVSGRKKGTATISFKVDGKPYTKKFTVLGYVNPVKSLKLTGVSSANLKAKFNKKSFVSEKLKANAKSGYLTASAASGWKITSAEWSDQGEDGCSRNFYSNKGVDSVKLITPKMSKTGSYYVWLYFLNVKTGARLNITYRLG